MVRSQFSTTDVASGEAFAYWREVICAVYVQLHAERADGELFVGSLRARQWSDVTISRVDAGSQTVYHPESDERDDCLLSLQVAGTGVVSQAGRDAVLRPGDFSVYDAARPYRLKFDDAFSQIVVQFPRGHLIDRGIDLDHAVARRSAAGDGLTDVVSGLVASLEAQRGELPASVRIRLSQQVVDLLANALAVGGFAQLSAPVETSARRQMILDHVVANLCDADLSVSSIASTFGVSTRSLQLLFAAGPTLRSQIRRLRLERAGEALTNPLLAHQSISRIGADHGFGDPAAFARAFRRHFERSPSQHRVQSQTRSLFGDADSPD